MKLPHVVLAVVFLCCWCSAAEDTAVVVRTVSDQGEVQNKSEIVAERKGNLIRLANVFIETFESVNGNKLRKEIEGEWAEKQSSSEHSENRAINEMLISKLESIKSKCEKSKEISPKLIFEACWAMAKYEHSRLYLPESITKLLLSDNDAYVKIVTFITLRTLSPEKVEVADKKKGD